MKTASATSDDANQSASQGSTRDLVSLVSPIYNEQENLEAFYAAVDEAVAGKDFDLEFIFVNDGSRDQSEKILNKLASLDPRMHVLSFSRNFGALSACNAGLREARGNAIVVMSADLQDPPSLIPDLVNAWRKGNEIVWAVRQTRDDPFFKRLFARAFYGVIRVLVFSDYPENGTDCGLFGRRAVEVYNLLPERDSSPFFTFYAFGFQQTRIPYVRRARERGKSSWPFWRRVKSCIDIVTTFSYAPLRVISATGVAFSTIALLYGTFLLVRRVAFGLGGEGWTSLAVLILFIGGMLALFIGIIAEYVWRIGEHTRQRPRYIIERRTGQAGKDIGTTANDPLHIDVSGMGRKPVAASGNEVVRQPHADGHPQAAE
ncbi:MAG: polyisoprenyl-phosphate glycosyltransferase [Alphaproteobacteria bacterium]|jgi:dolichol-phosphate mannosyltransferase|nr:polyisoprenyl-phosphate glycosyltransferase [Alphaproteobacteria bacterium]